MLERIFGKPKVRDPEPDVKHVMPNHEEIVSLGHDAKQYIKGFLEGLTRTQLMDFEDAKQFDGTKAEDAAWEAVNDAEWERDWPLGKDSYEERIPSIVNDSIPIKYRRKQDKNGREIDLDLNKLVEQMEGIQKKLDKVETLIANAEFKLCGKDALKL